MPKLLLLLLTLTSFAARLCVAATPTGSEILMSLHPAHPRLLAHQEDFVALKHRVATNSVLTAWQKKLTSAGQQLLNAPVSKYEIPDGLRLLATSRQVLQRVYTLSLLYQLSDDPRYVDRVWRELEAAAAFPDWNPKHFLDTAEMTHAFAIGYDWLYTHWKPEQRDLLRQAILTKGIAPALPIYREWKGWARAAHNWNQVCNGGMGMGALALADTDPAVASEVLHHCLRSLPPAMAEFAPDGAWKEGPGYWNYATDYNVVILAAMQTALGTDFGLSQTRGFPQTGLFPLYINGPFGRTFNYADSGDRAIRAPQLFWLARMFDSSPMAVYESEHAAPQPLDLLWFDSPKKSDALPLDRYFRGAEVVSLRSEWDNPTALFAAFKAGDNKANHSHLDLGSFVFDALGHRWAMDLGGDDYNLPGYFGKQRWTYYRLRTEGQNTLVINPGDGPGQDPAANAKIIRFASTPTGAFGIADLTRAYAADARKVQRGLALQERKRLLIQDEIEARTPAEVYWFMHTPAQIELLNSGRTARLRQSQSTLFVHLLSPAEASFTDLPAEPLASSPHPLNQAKNRGLRKLTVHLQGVTETTIRVLLSPEAETSLVPGERPLASW